MLKRSILLRASPIIFALSAGISYGSSIPPLTVSPNFLEISAKNNFDAIANKRIYRSVKATKSKGQKLRPVFIPDSTDTNVRVTTIASTCDSVEMTECELRLELFGSAGEFSGKLHFEVLEGTEFVEVNTILPIRGKLETKVFSSPEKNIPEQSDDQKFVDYTPIVQLLSCEDLDALDENLTKQCKTIYKTFMNTKSDLSDAKNVCTADMDVIERSRCEGLVEGTKLSTCENLDAIGSTTCNLFKKAAVKSCDANDFDCESMQRLMHGYLDCADHAHSDFISVCVAFQNAYIDGISGDWMRNSFLPLARAHKKGDISTKNSPSLAYINPKRIEALNVSKEDLDLLINIYPTLTRSTLLNTNHSKMNGMSKMDLWKQIESHIGPKQTVGYELECPGIQLDITSNHNNERTAKWLRYDGYGDFSNLLPEEDVNRKKLAIDAAFEKEYASFLSMLTDYGIWEAKKEWPYFNTYGKSLFQSKETYLKFPILNATLESRYSYNHFPHIEMVTAPLTHSSEPLNHKSAMRYISDLVGQTCDLSSLYNIHFTKVDDWKKLVEKTSISSSGKFIEFENTIDSPLFENTPLVCQTSRLHNCHVQSNVGVYFDQLFTDSLLMQSIGSNDTYHTDKVYDAAWTIAKKTFSVLQWDSEGKHLVDARNHAAGVFTYFVYELYLRSILYSGKFDFWKGTLSHLMKYNLRDVWKTLTSGEQELFMKAVLALWSEDEVPEELASLTETILNEFIEASKVYGDPALPSREIPDYSEEFASKVNGVFKELIWTVGLADDETYNRASENTWGSIVAEGTDLNYFDPSDFSTRTRRAFVHGCQYGSHPGTQCDIAKVIAPVKSSVDFNGKLHPRTYVVVETRYGDADFNEAVFWRCHEHDRSTVLKHECR